MIKAKGCGIMGCVMVLIVNLLIGGFCARYVVEFWSPYLFHKTIMLPWIAAILIGLVGGEVIIPGALITYIILFFI